MVAEARFLDSAIGDVLTLIDAGSVPRTAIVKVASKRSLLPDQVDRLCQLYNRSNSIATRVGGDGLVHKISAIDVVDPVSIREELQELQSQKSAMAANEKIAAMPVLARVLSQPVSAEPPTPSPLLTNRKEAQAPVQEINPNHGLYHGLTLKQASAVLDSLNADYEAAQRGIATAMLHAEMAQQACLEKINAKVAAGADEFLQQFHSKLKSTHPNVHWVSDDITHYAISKLPGYKQAEFKLLEDYAPVEELPYLDEAIESVVKYAAAAEHLEDSIRVHGTQSVKCRELAWIIKSNLTDGGVKNSAFYIGDKTLADEQMAHVEKVATVAQSFIGAQMAGASRGDSEPKGSSREEAFVLKLGNPQHEANLRAIRTRAALQQLMVDDPVISSAPEDEVISAYNEIANYAPRSVESPAVLRSVLRQYLQNNASAMDLATIRKLERQGEGERAPRMD